MGIRHPILQTLLKPMMSGALTQRQAPLLLALQPPQGPTPSQSPQAAGISRLGLTPGEQLAPPTAAPAPAPHDVAAPAAAPGNAQAQNIVQEDPGKDHLPVIVLGALLGAVTIALLAGVNPQLLACGVASTLLHIPVSKLSFDAEPLCTQCQN